MGKIEPDPMTAQFLADYDAAWKHGLFKTQADFCRLTGADKAVLNLVLKGNRLAPMSLIQHLKSIYNVEVNSNDPNMELQTLKMQLKATEERLKAIEEAKDAIIRAKDETIEVLRSQQGLPSLKPKSRTA